MNPFRHPVLRNWRANLLVGVVFACAASLCERYGMVWGVIMWAIGIFAGVGIWFCIEIIRRRRPPF